MANEVIITYYAAPSSRASGNTAPLYGKALGGQVLNIASLSAEIPDYVDGVPVGVIRGDTAA